MKINVRHLLAGIAGNPLTFIFLLALSTRLFLFFIMIDHLDNQGLNQATPDVKNYIAAADAIRSDLDFKTLGVRTFGPGFPIILALWGFFFSPNPKVLLIIQIIIGSLGSVLLAELAAKLTRDNLIGLFAGFINATSVVAIGLANTLLSDSFFFVLVITGLLFYLRGLENLNWKYFLVAGLIIGYSALTRSIGQYLFLILLPLALLYRPKDGRVSPSVKVRLKYFAVSFLGIILMLTPWMIRNNIVVGTPSLAAAGPLGLLKLSATIQAETSGTTYQETISTFFAEIQSRQESPEDYDKIFSKYANEKFRQVLFSDPLTSLRVFLINVNTNVNTEWGPLHYLLPKWSQQIKAIYASFDERKWSYRVSILSFAGIGILLYRKKYGLTIILVTFLLYFAVLSGFTFWQGNRVYYPAQMAWSILISYAAKEPIAYLIKIISAYSPKNADTALPR